MRLWRWLCCRTGHHRETVLEHPAPPPGSLARSLYRMDWLCVDCGRARVLCYGMRRTPSRRYALRGKA